LTSKETISSKTALLHGAYATNTHIIHSIFSYRFQPYLDIQGELNHRVNYILSEIHIIEKYANKYALEIITKHIIHNLMFIGPCIIVIVEE